MAECATCGHTLDAHLKGEDNNGACPCCRWQEPWEEVRIPDVKYDANPFYAMDEDERL